MQLVLQTVPNAIWTFLILVNVFFIAIVYTNATVSRSLWLSEVVLSAILAALLQVQQSTNTSQPQLQKAAAITLLVLSILTFVRRDELSSSQQKFAIATFAFCIAIAVKYLFTM